MFCPQCGSTQSDELKFCKNCGANLQALRQVLATRTAEESKFDWSKTWVAEMFMSSKEAARRAAELDRLQGKTPEVRRRNEIKAGVITASAGIGLMMVLFVLMEGIVRSGRVSEAAIEILSRIWIVGFIPLMVGIALIVNGVFISKRTDEVSEKERGGNRPYPEEEKVSDTNILVDRQAADQYLPPADTNDRFPGDFSVTDETTRHLEEAPVAQAKGAKSD